MGRQPALALLSTATAPRRSPPHRGTAPAPPPRDPRPLPAVCSAGLVLSVFDYLHVHHVWWQPDHLNADPDGSFALGYGADTWRLLRAGLKVCKQLDTLPYLSWERAAARAPCAEL